MKGPSKSLVTVTLLASRRMGNTLMSEKSPGTRSFRTLFISDVHHVRKPARSRSIAVLPSHTHAAMPIVACRRHRRWLGVAVQLALRNRTTTSFRPGCVSKRARAAKGRLRSRQSRRSEENDYYGQFTALILAAID